MKFWVISSSLGQLLIGHITNCLPGLFQKTPNSKSGQPRGLCWSYCNWSLFPVSIVTPIRLFFTVDFTNWCLCLFFSLAYNCQGQRIYLLALHVLLSRVMPGMWEKIANPWSMLSRTEQAAVMLYSTFPLVNQPVGMAWGTPAMCLSPLPETTSSPLIEKHQFKSPDPYATALRGETEEAKPNRLKKRLTNLFLVPSECKFIVNKSTPGMR